MPAIIPLIPLLIGGITLGESLFSGKAGQPQTAAPEAAPKPPDQTAQKEAFLAAAPSVQERLGGSVSPDFFASEVARVSGDPKDTELAKQVLSQFLGLGSTPEKQKLSETGETAGDIFSPFSVSSGGGGGAEPKHLSSFFEGLVGGGQQEGGSGLDSFSGGFQ